MSNVRLLSILLVCTGLVAGTTAFTAEALPIEGPVKLPDQTVAQGKSVDVLLPPLPMKAGKITLLTFRAVTVAAGPGGCNWNLAVQINGVTPARYSTGATERLLGRSPALQLVRERLGFPVFGGDKLMTMYAKDADQGDAMTTDGLGATYPLDVTDLVRGVDGNTVTFRNLFPGQMPAGQGQLQVTDLAVGYLDRAKLPQIPSQAPTRGAIGGGVTVGKLRLAQSCSGGFSVRYGEGPELRVETDLGMKAQTRPALLAEDNTDRVTDLDLHCFPATKTGYELTAKWPALTLDRTLTIKDGLVFWHEKWTNTSDQRRAVPWHHLLFLRGQSTQFWVGGSQDNCSLACSPANPTMFIQPTGEGNGFGLTAESDWLKLLATWRGMNDLGEVFTDCLALSPGKSLEFDFTITPVTDGGGYWAFLNGLRQRWGMNATTMSAPLFWGFTRATGGTQEENIKKSLAHLGPAIITIGPWQRLEPDSRVLTAGLYPKLPAAAPRTTGLCPDLDVDAFLTFAHREPYWTEVKDLTALIHKTCPQAKVIEMIHPAMEAVYKPLQDRWPIAADVIKTENGQSMDEPGYSRSWLGDMTKKDWGVLYYCPHEGGPELKAILDGMRRGMDDCALDGIYSDEFAFAFNSRGYSRYDYSRSDGYSVDLDEKGNVAREKADNGWLSQAAQLAILGEVSKRGKFFLGNGGNVLQSTRQIPHQHFIEGGNGPSQWGQGHLDAVPLVLGNMGDDTTLKEVFASVKLCLRYGSVYSPMAVNLLLTGDDNFVCKLYPLTIQQLGPGYVIGRERIITTVSRAFDWPGVSGKVRLYRYNAEGIRVEVGAELTATKGKPVALTVPEGGLVIAERE